MAASVITVRIDLYDRSVVASITDRNITADLAKRTLEKAIHSEPGINW